MQGFDAEAAEAVLRGELEPGERLERAGCPRALTLAFQRLPRLAFFAVWVGGGGYAFLGAMASEHAASAAIPFLMLAFGLFGVWNTMVVLIAVWKTFYGVTDCRLLLLRFGLRRRVASSAPQQITCVERRDRGGGRGDVTFHKAQQPSEDGSSLAFAAFVDVAGVRTVEACIRRLAAS